MMCHCKYYYRELRPRPEKAEEPSPEKPAAAEVVKETSEKMIPARCKECRQLLDDPDLQMFQGDPEDSVGVN